METIAQLIKEAKMNKYYYYFTIQPAFTQPGSTSTTHAPGFRIHQKSHRETF